MSDLEQPTQTTTFESWALVELMGRQRLVGKAREESHFGTALLRVDVPAQGDDAAYTKFFGGSAIYCITPVSEDVAKRLLANVRPDPVPMWELRPRVEMLPAGNSVDEDDDLRPSDSGADDDEDEPPSDYDPAGNDEDLLPSAEVIGAKSTCKACGQPIIYSANRCWEHVSMNGETPRHFAEPTLRSGLNVT